MREENTEEMADSPKLPIKEAVKKELWTRDLEGLIDDTMLSRPIQIRSMPERHAPLPGTGKLYYDITNKKLKMYIDADSGWADIQFTTTSTTTSTTSTSTSTSTSTTT